MRTLFTLTSAIAIAAALPAIPAQAQSGDRAENRAEMRAQVRAERRAERRREARIEAREEARVPRARAEGNAVAERRQVEQRMAARQAEARQERRQAEARQEQRQARARRAERQQAEARQERRQAEARQQQRREAARSRAQAEARQSQRREAAQASARAEARQDRRRAVVRAEARADARQRERRVEARQERSRLRILNERRDDARERRQAIARAEARRENRIDRRVDRVRAERIAEYRARQAAARRIADRRADYRQRMLRQQRAVAQAELRQQARIRTVNFYRNRAWQQAAYRDRMNRIWRQQARQQARVRQARAMRYYNYGQRWRPVNSGYYYSPALVQRIVRYRQPAYYYPQRYDYRYAGGYAYRVDPETQLISALLPLLGGAFGIGQTLPAGYNVYNLPTQYRTVYPDSGPYAYRYGDNAIYRVDPASGTILGVPSLLTPGFQVGRPLPAGYGVYNVPYDYRDRYYDTDDYLYRYNNGHIYQVDATTRLVTAAIELFV